MLNKKNSMPQRLVRGNTRQRGIMVRKGSALLSALLIMTLIAIAATAMSTRLQLDIYRTSMAMESEKRYLASQAVLFWGMDALSNNPLKLKGPVLLYPKALRNVAPGTQLQGELTDLQAKFNINNLRDPQYRGIFLNLLKNTQPNLSADEREAILTAIVEWISPYQPGRGVDKFLTYYTNQKPAYLPGYQPMVYPSALRQVQGISPTIYNALQPYITALPETTPININHAPRIVLESLGRGLSDAEVSELLMVRGKTGAEKQAELDQLLLKLQLNAAQVTLESQYFLITITASSAARTNRYQYILQRKRTTRGIKITFVGDKTRPLFKPQLLF